MGFQTDLLLRNVDGVTDYLRSRDLERLRRVKEGSQEEIAAYGLPQDRGADPKGYVSGCAHVGLQHGQPLDWKLFQVSSQESS